MENNKTRQRIGILIDSNSNAAGSFTYSMYMTKYLINFLSNKYEISLYSTDKSSFNILQSEFKVKPTYFKASYMDYFLIAVADLFNLKLLKRSKLDKILKNDRIGLLIFTSPSFLSTLVSSSNFIYCIWDMCHINNIEWPEIRENNQHQIRNSLYSSTLNRATFLIVDSQETKCEINDRYRYPKNKTFVMPLGTFNPRKATKGLQNSRLLDLPDRYFYYPAQYWRHKNHAKLIMAFEKFVHLHPEYHLIFSGKDLGFKSEIINSVDKSMLREKILILDYVNYIEKDALMKSSQGLIFPSYFGPTNIPPQEAWASGIPVAISNIHSKHYIGDAAVLFNPSDVNEIFQSMEKLIDNDIKTNLIKNGKNRLVELENDRVLFGAEINTALESLFLKLN
jgi:glycosyltransferase involved in cell wall biosynthesis